ncbi:uncharacterized protein LOC129227805 [Uloborus diversus]|uniref:uncharacterized protein LOC129227805 n=1 Tax=Uloborus diversus TaxID=327109 RepID=UPI002408F412|nr:uncharacterized protein LOC129227805 [Uloborus diversus]
MLFIDIIGVFVVINLPCFFGKPITLNWAQKVALSSLFVEEIFACSNQESKQWSYDFHECFIDRKANDGGRDLESIVDRILDHSKDCIRKSDKKCRPYYDGFIIIMEKVIQQIKDYADMYLEYIHNGRSRIRDLNCVENVLSIETYSECFKGAFKYNSSELEFGKEIENSIRCTNQKNNGCSDLARTDLNAIVRILMGVDAPENGEDFWDSEPTESTDPPEIRWEDVLVTDPPKQQEQPQPWAWYDYVLEPFRYAWSAIRSFFGF